MSDWFVKDGLPHRCASRNDVGREGFNNEDAHSVSLREVKQCDDLPLNLTLPTSLREAQRRGNPSFLKIITVIIDYLNGNHAYNAYLKHHALHHQSKPLDKNSFLKIKNQDKWNKINRCC